MKLSNRNERVFVAEADGTLLGYIDVRAIVPGRSRFLKNLVSRIIRQQAPPSFVRSGTVGRIEDCYVDTELRQQGIGDALVAQGLTWLRGRGASSIQLAVLAANNDAIAFWEKQGFCAYQFLMSKAAK